MSRQQKQKRCRACGRKTLHVKTELRKSGCAVHFFLTLVTCGIWIPVAMLLLGLESVGDLAAPYHCQVCGKRN